MPKRGSGQQMESRTTRLDSTYIIPVVSENDRVVTGAIIARIDDISSYKLVLLKDYQAHNSNKASFIKAMMVLDAKVYGYSKFKVKDPSALDDIKEVFFTKGTLSSNSNRTASDDPCEIIEIWYDPDGDSDPCDCSGNEYYTGEWYYADEENCFSTTPQPVLSYLINETGGGYYLPSGYYTLPDLSGGSGGGSNPPYTPVFTTEQKSNYLVEQLNLDQTQQFYLVNTENAVSSLFNYLYNNATDERKENCKNHLNTLGTDPDYSQFIQHHNNTGDANIVWWIDDTWLDNADNFNLDITRANNQYDRLTVAEKALVAVYPVQAYIIKKNVQPVFDMTDARMGTGAGLNDKKDAFRHAFVSSPFFSARIS